MYVYAQVRASCICVYVCYTHHQPKCTRVFVLLLQCAAVSYDFREVQVEHKDENGNVIKTQTFRTCSTDHWRFWGSSGGKSKKNDHIFYSACLKKIVNYYKSYLNAKGISLGSVKVWTDNCPGPFGCAQNYAVVAKADEDLDCLISQYFAEIMCFKCIVDAIGKVRNQIVFTTVCTLVSVGNVILTICLYVYFVLMQTEWKRTHSQGRGIDQPFAERT